MIMKPDKPQSAVSTLEYNYTRRAADGIVPIWDPGRADVSIQVQIQEKKIDVPAQGFEAGGILLFGCGSDLDFYFT